MKNNDDEKQRNTNADSELRGTAVVEVIKDIKVSIQDMKKLLQTGLGDNKDIYSTSADDYMDKYMFTDDNESDFTDNDDINE